MTKILIIDDHESMRDCLKDTFEKTDGFEVVGSIPSAAFAEAYCEKLHPDLMVTDVCTEGGASGLEAAKRVKARFPDIKIIVMSGFDEITYAPRARELGEDAFIYKHKSLDYFASAARGVIDGEKFFPEPRTIPMPGGEAPLTDREMEVLRLMCRHLTSREIAEELFISEATVKYHKANMLAKTGFARAIDLAFYMLSNGWINPLY